MQEPLRIMFHNMQPPFGAEDLVRDGAAELERFFDPVTVCEVAVEKRHRPHQRGNLYHVSIELMLPDDAIIVHRNPPQDCPHEGLHTAIADGFTVAWRRLQDHTCEA